MEPDETKNYFRMMISNPDFNTVIDLDPTPPSTPAQRQRLSTTADETTNDDRMDVVDEE